MDIFFQNLRFVESSFLINNYNLQKARFPKLERIGTSFLGCAKNRIPVVVDGFISIVAALCAVRLCENVRGYLIPSHHSFELGYQIAAKALEFDAYLMLGMRLGEGNGCPIAFEIVDAACAVINTMATFDEAEINDDYLTDIRKADSFTVV